VGDRHLTCPRTQLDQLTPENAELYRLYLNSQKPDSGLWPKAGRDSDVDAHLRGSPDDKTWIACGHIVTDRFRKFSWTAAWSPAITS